VAKSELGILLSSYIRQQRVAHLKVAHSIHLLEKLQCNTVTFLTSTY